MELRFRLFDIPVSVSLFFFLTVFLISGPQVRRSPALAAGWIAIAFAGVLLHELGHALVVRRYGARCAIDFHALGGATSWRAPAPLSPMKLLLVSAAGPAVGIVVGGAALMLRPALTTPGTLVDEYVRFVVIVNLGWAVFNLLPMLPMDGGKVMSSLLEMAFPGGGPKAARVVSLLLSIALAGLMLLAGSVFGVLIAALFAWSNFQALQAARIERLAAAEAAGRSPGGAASPADSLPR